MTQWAYPYATAAFEYAQEQQQVARWSEMLHWLAKLSKEPLIKQLLMDPRCDAMAVADVFIELGKNVLDQAAHNFIKLLAEHHRLVWLESIAVLFSELQADLEKTKTAEVITAVSLTEQQRNQLIDQLRNQFNRNIRLTEKIDKNIVGGFVVHVDDQVIDYSIRGQLARLKQQLRSGFNVDRVG